MLTVSNIMNIPHLRCGPDPGCLILDAGCMDPDCIFIQYRESSIQYRSADATKRIISKSLEEKEIAIL